MLAAELVDIGVDGTGVLGVEGRRLRERLGEEQAWAVRFAAVRDFIGARAAGECRSPRPEVIYAWRSVVRSGGTVAMDDLARAVHLSARQFRAEFVRELGIGPKAASTTELRPRTPPPPTVWPAFQARDASAPVTFLVEAFGFVPTTVHQDGDRVVHAQLDWPEGGGVMFGSHKEEGFFRPPGTAGMYVVTARIHEVHQRARAYGLDAPDLVEQDYGSTEFTVADPEGNLWTFGTYAGQPRADDL